MPDGYSWSDMRDTGTYRLPGPEHIGWWAAVAMAFSVFFHVLVFFALYRMNITLGYHPAQVIETERIHVSPVPSMPAEQTNPPPPETVVTPPDNASTLLEEVDILEALPKDQEIDINPKVEEPEFAMQMVKPAIEGDPTAMAMEISSGLEMEADLPELGREPSQLKPAEIGQVTVDPGAANMDDDLGKFTEDLIKRGAGGNTDKGALDGIATLDDLLDLPPNLLVSKKTMLPSDLLFEFNKAELRESAKVGLMKLALLMDRNPGLYCWIEGHTDLVGGDEFNMNLSVRRAEAVRNHLVESMRMDASRIITRGFGRMQPIVTGGTPEEQAVNRRVEIRMRKTKPTGNLRESNPQKARIIEEIPPETQVAPETPKPANPPKAVLVKPKRVLPLEEIEDTPPAAAPRAQPVIPQALPVEPEIPKATPRATPVEP